MATLLQISQLGHPVLRKTAEDIKVIADLGIQALIDDMIETCRDVDGVGIAAPQVYRPLRLFIVASGPNPRYPNAPQMAPMAMINPLITSVSDETEKDWEGCLSIPGIRGHVPRHRSLTVSFTTRQGQRQEMTFDGFLARIVQHEFDHIEGRVFLDRTDSKDLITEREYQKRFRF